MGITETGEAIRSIAERVGPHVVGIGQRWGVGSGVVVGDARVVTNAHNVRREEVAITLNDGSAVTGTVEGADVDRDIALVDLPGREGGIEWPETQVELRIGDPVFALSNPGGRGLRVTFGFVSGTQRSFRGPRGRRIAGSIEHTAPLLPGSSGGPIVDDKGRLLGINTNRLGEGFYLAIPADDALRGLVATLGRRGSPAKPRLGVGLAPAQVGRDLRRAVGLPEADGLLVRAVEDNSPAAAAGIETGDLLVEAGGRPLDSFDALFDALDDAVGGELTIKMLRGAEERTVTVSFPSTAAA